MKWLAAELIQLFLTLLIRQAASSQAVTNSSSCCQRQDSRQFATVGVREEQLVSQLLDPRRYNKNHRPAAHSITDVMVNLHIVSFSTMSVQNMDFTVNIYLRMIWKDQRLAHNASNPNASISLHTMKDQIWLPDIFFRNAKQVEKHADPIPNILVKLQPSGMIYFSQKLKVRLWCIMDLRDFPMDCQTCRIEMGAYGSSVSEVRFHWFTANVTLEEDAMQIPEFSGPSISVRNCTKSFSVTGEFACLRANIRMRRAFGFYLMNTYAPFTLMVCISWVGFWIDARATPARVTIAFLTVLAVVTQNAGAQMTGMPRVSYAKAIDLFMMASLMFVIAALMEFAAASYLARQRDKPRGDSSKRRQGPLRLEDLNKANTAVEVPSPEVTNDNNQEEAREALSPSRQRTGRRCRLSQSRSLDYWSRFVFPTVYAVFQAVYWAYYTRGRDNCGGLG